MYAFFFFLCLSLCISTCSAQLSMLLMKRRSRITLIIIICEYMAGKKRVGRCEETGILLQTTVCDL